MRLFPILLALSVAGPVIAQHSPSSSAHAMAQPFETGQSTFAAIAEIVAILRSDPKTDWELVDIAGLRRHLVDMNLVTTETQVTRSLRPSGVRFEIRGTPRVLEAIRALVPAHAPFLASETGWDVRTSLLVDGITLIVDGNPKQIQGLGFFGMMTIGTHHQEHHMMLAKGSKPHD